MSTPASAFPTHTHCPYCGGLIRVEAVKCRHCQRLIDAPSRLGVHFAADFWGPLLVVFGGIALLAVLLHLGGPASSPEPFASATVPLPITQAGKKPVIGEPSEVPPMDGLPGGPTAPGAAPPGGSSGPAAGGPLGDPGLVGDPEVPPPLQWKPRYRSVSGEPKAGFGAPTPPTTGSSGPVAGAGQEPPAAEPDAPARPRELRSPLFGYGLRLSNERHWSLVFSGTSRDALLRQDSTARLQLWVDLQPDRPKADGATCLRDYLARLERRLRRTGLKVKGQATGTRGGRHGLTLHTAERDAIGSGPRRHAGRYLVAFAADGNLCYGFEGFAGQPASRVARAEVREAFTSFDVDGTARSHAATTANRRQILAAVSKPSPAVLLDVGTSLASLFPGDASGWRMLGEAFMAGNRPAQAVRALERARAGREEGQGDEAKMSRFTLDTLIADGHARLKRWELAEKALDAARVYFADHPFLAYAEACLAAQQGGIDRALNKLESAFGAWPAKAAPPRLPHGLATQVALARRDSRLAALQKEPSFEILLRRFEARARKAGE